MNSSLFHKAMIQRRQHNCIFSLKDPHGNRLVQHQDLEQTLVNHFWEILTKLDQNRMEAITRVKQFIPNVVNRDHDLALLREIIIQEVEEVVKILAKNKALRPDGFTAELFQASWSFIGKDILDLVEES